MKLAFVLTTSLLGCVAGLSAGGTLEPEPEAVPMADPRIPPGTWTLEEKQYWIKLQDEFDAYVAKTNEQCGAKITARFVHESFRGQLKPGTSFGLDLDTRAMCGAMANSLIEVCNGGATAKDAVATQIRQLECAFGPARYAIKNGVFHATINTEPKTLDTGYNAMLAVIKKSL